MAASTSSTLRETSLHSTDAEFHCQFLQDFPAEIRNQIYSFVAVPFAVVYLPFVFHALIRPRELYSDPLDPTQQGPFITTSEALRQAGPVLLVDRRVRRNKDRPKTQIVPPMELWKLNVGLLFVCRQTYQEFAPILYSRLTIAFGSQKLLRHRLNFDDWTNPTYSGTSLPRLLVAASSKLQYITALYLQCDEYGSPADNEERGKQLQYYENWASLCSRMARKMRFLKQLSLRISIPIVPPIRLVLADMWFTPFLEFKACKSIQEVTVTIIGSENWFAEPLLKVIGEVLRRVILGWDVKAAFSAISQMKRFVQCWMTPHLSPAMRRRYQLLMEHLKTMEKTNGMT